MAENVKLLLVEDDPSFGTVLKDYLQINDYDVTHAIDGEEGWAKFKNEKFNLIILDVMMPKKDGFTLAKDIKESNPDIPIIFLTAKNMREDVLKGYKLGADDYITKPFSPRELSARIRTHLRRKMYYDKQQHEKKSVLTFDHLTIDLARHLVVSYGKEVDLSAKEFNLLICMAKHPGRIFSVEELYERVWGEFSFGDTRTVNVHISSLRKKIERDPAKPEFILTVRGAGYKFMNV